MTNEQAPDSSTRRRPGRKPYPPLGFEQVLEVSRGIIEHGVDDEMRRLTLFQELGRNPNSRQSRTLVTNSNRYGLTTGSYRAERIHLTPEGKRIASSDFHADAGVLQLTFNHAIAGNDVFSYAYDTFKNRRLPSESVIHDIMSRYGVEDGDLEEAAISLSIMYDSLG